MLREEVSAGVRACVAEALELPPESVAEEARLIGDLGADSLDLLDLTFRLEQRFGIAISPRELERRIRAKLGAAPLEVDGVYTPEAMEELRAAMPEVPREELPDGLSQSELPARLRVVTLVNVVGRLLEERTDG